MRKHVVKCPECGQDFTNDSAPYTARLFHFREHNGTDESQEGRGGPFIHEEFQRKHYDFFQNEAREFWEIFNANEAAANTRRANRQRREQVTCPDCGRSFGANTPGNREDRDNHVNSTHNRERNNRQKRHDYNSNAWEDFFRDFNRGRGGETPQQRSSASDTRTQEDKLRAMANQTASPEEAKVAKHMLFKKFGKTS